MPLAKTEGKRRGPGLRWRPCCRRLALPDRSGDSPVLLAIPAYVQMDGSGLILPVFYTRLMINK